MIARHVERCQRGFAGNHFVGNVEAIDVLGRPCGKIGGDIVQRRIDFFGRNMDAEDILRITFHGVQTNTIARQRVDGESPVVANIVQILGCDGVEKFAFTRKQLNIRLLQNCPKAALAIVGGRVVSQCAGCRTSGQLYRISHSVHSSIQMIDSGITIGHIERSAVPSKPQEIGAQRRLRKPLHRHRIYYFARIETETEQHRLRCTARVQTSVSCRHTHRRSAGRHRLVEQNIPRIALRRCRQPTGNQNHNHN